MFIYERKTPVVDSRRSKCHCPPRSARSQQQNSFIPLRRSNSCMKVHLSPGFTSVDASTLLQVEPARYEYTDDSRRKRAGGGASATATTTTEQCGPGRTCDAHGTATRRGRSAVSYLPRPRPVRRGNQLRPHLLW